MYELESLPLRRLSVNTATPKSKRDESVQSLGFIQWVTNIFQKLTMTVYTMYI